MLRQLDFFEPSPAENRALDYESGIDCSTQSGGPILNGRRDGSRAGPLNLPTAGSIPAAPADVELLQGLVSMPPARRGAVGELIIGKLCGFEKTTINRWHDLYDAKNQQRIEVKASAITEVYGEPLSCDNVIESITRSGKEKMVEKMVPYAKRHNHFFSKNMNQVKPDEFDVLHYVLFFLDCILLFKLSAYSVVNDDRFQYHDKQHKGGTGEGYFNVNSKNLSYHINEYLYHCMSYQEFRDLFPGPVAQLDLARDPPTVEVIGSSPIGITNNAPVAKTVDAPASKPGPVKRVLVRFKSGVPKSMMMPRKRLKIDMKKRVWRNGRRSRLKTGRP